MAAYNTAFGVLPSPKTQLFGGNAGGGMAGAPPKPQQQQQAPREEQQAQMTFAQMQQRGQARPAPQTLQAQQERRAAGAQQGNEEDLLEKLRQQLQQPAPQQTQQLQPAQQPQPQAQGAPAAAPPPPQAPPPQAAPAEVAPGVAAAGGGMVNMSMPMTSEELPPPPMDLTMPPPGGGDFRLGQSFRGGQSSQQLLDRLMQQLGGMEGQQSVYDDPRFQQRREAAMANLEAERQASESELNSEMARRGLFASSIASGRMGDIAGQFARAQASLEGDLLKEAMGQDIQRQQFLTQQLGQVLGTVGEQELGGFRANIESAKAQADINARAAELQQEARLRGRELDLTAARDQAGREYQSGQLALGYAEMGSRERMSANELAARREMQREEQTFRAGESELERALRLNLQQGEQTFQAGQSKLERDLREAMQTRDLTASERRQLQQIEAERERQRDSQTFQAEQNRIEQALREKMQTTELSAAEKRQLADIEAQRTRDEAGRRFQSEQSDIDRGMQRDTQRTQFLTQLASILAPMSKKDRDAFLAANPQIASLIGGQSRTAYSPSGGVVSRASGVTGRPPGGQDRNNMF